MKLLTNRDTHNYNTRNGNKLRLPRISRNWGKQRVCYHAVKDWNSLDEDTVNTSSIRLFKRNMLRNFFNPID